MAALICREPDVAADARSAITRTRRARGEAAALATLEVIENERRARARADAWEQAFARMRAAAAAPDGRDVRGVGLLLGIELVSRWRRRGAKRNGGYHCLAHARRSWWAKATF
jgi:4-aminobutyrate aminotransferase-like enzyme